ncbi:UNVERIFIED_CONTAM: hypothetical protein DES50_101250 [Williamsia faeni]
MAKGVLPFVPVSERIEIVRHITYVDSVYEETVPDKINAWQHLGFHCIFKGDDWRGTEKGRRLEREFGQVGVEVVYFPYTASTSSTKLRLALEIANESELRRGSSDAG